MKKEAKEAEGQQHIAEAKARAAGKEKTTVTLSSYKVFHHIEAFKKAPEYTSDTLNYSCCESQAVMVKIGKEQADKLREIMSREELKTFQKDATENGLFKTKGRIAKQVNWTGIESDEVARYITSSSNDVLAELAPAEKVYLRTPWYFVYGGSMASRGTEYSFLTSIK